ncbi:hypothetical protein CRG98_048116 [Punica granatum]|uniref:Uncharacterized protein n=1 Tax=Punica granatum TaxID=22663 RepID=A0A2I0HIH1_PUNGR|nr:hypothetical protein CRG98_048116 [Punica granatum]
MPWLPTHRDRLPLLTCSPDTSPFASPARSLDRYLSLTPRDASPKHGVAQAVFAAASRAIAAVPRGGTAVRGRQTPFLCPTSSSPVTLSHGLGPSFFVLRRSSPVCSAQSSPAETVRLDPTFDLLHLTRRFGPVPVRSAQLAVLPAQRSLSRPNSRAPLFMLKPTN